MVVYQNTLNSGSSQQFWAADAAQHQNAICLDSLQIAKTVMLAHICMETGLPKNFALVHDETCLVFAILGSVAVVWHL